MNKKFTIISVMLSLFLFLGAAFVPIRAEASQTYGDIGPFLGDLVFADNTFVVPLSFSYSNIEYYANGSVQPSAERATYSGIATNMLRIYGDPGTFLNGMATSSYTFQVEGARAGTISAQLIDSYHDDISINVLVKSVENNKTVMTIYVNFDNFEITSEEFYVPLNFNVFYSTSLSTVDDYVEPNIWINANGDEWIDEVIEYSDVRDLPGYYGDYALQNQDIIDGIENNTSAVNDMSSYLGNQIKYYAELIGSTISSEFNKLINNLTIWYNGLTDTINNGIDRLLTSYTGTGTTEAADKFDDSAGELQTVESDLTGITNSGINDYSTAAFDTSIITTLGPSLVYVVTWFTNFWNMGGIFTSLLNVGLALFVAFFILRLTGGSD